MPEVSAYCGGKGIADIKEGVGLEGLREYADVLEVNDPDISSPNIVEEVVLANVGMIDEEIVRKRERQRRLPRAARIRLSDVLSDRFGVDEGYRRPVILEESVQTHDSSDEILPKTESGTEGVWARSHLTAEATLCTASSSGISEVLSVGIFIFSMAKKQYPSWLQKAS